MKSFSQYINEGQQEKIDACTFLGIDYKPVSDAQLNQLTPNRYETTLFLNSLSFVDATINTFFLIKPERGNPSRMIAYPDKSQDAPKCVLWYRKNNIAGFSTKKIPSLKKIITDYYAQFNKAFDKLFDDVKDNDKLSSRDLLDIINKKHKQNFGETAWIGNVLSLTYTNRNYDKSIRLPNLRIEVDFNNRTAYAENFRPMFGESTYGKLDFYTYSKQFLSDIDKINNIIKKSTVL